MTKIGLELTRIFFFIAPKGRRRMTDNTNDWANEIEQKIADEYASHGAILAADADGMIASALRKARADGEEIGERRGRATGLMEASESCIELGRFRRKAKAEGMREAAKRMDDMPSLTHFADELSKLYSLADKIERGEA
jgi:hypothetical protein